VSRLKHIVGIDEVGRGPLAGPVTVCALTVPATFNMKFFRGITDSKKLSPEVREKWFWKIKQAKKEGKLDYKVSHISAKIIDEKGIAGAVRIVLNRSLSRLRLPPRKTRILLDGLLYAPNEYTNQKTIIGGDAKEKLISAASVVAKVTRDAKMVRFAKQFPKYGFEIHKGYGTDFHRKMIRKHSLSELHRRSFCKKF